MSRRVLMLLPGSPQGDSRVLREAEALLHAGWQVHLVGRDVAPAWEPPAGLLVRSVSGGSGLSGRAGGRAGGQSGSTLRGWRRAARWALLPRHRASTWRTWRAGVLDLLADDPPYDVVHAHDFVALPVAAALARRWKAALVYDAHEYWRGRARHGRPTPVERRREAREEDMLLRQAALVITVSDAIAGRLAAAGAADVVVVRNTFPPRAPVAVTSAARGLVYAGRIAAGRDLTTALKAARLLRERLETVLVGPADPGWLAGHDLSGVDLRTALDVDDVDVLLGELGVALVTLEDSCPNHRMALPNKLFQAVRAGVPVVAADLPEMRAVVQRHQLGELYRPGDAASLAQAALRVAGDYDRLRASVLAAQAELSWTRDAASLVEAYERLPG